MDPLRGTQVRPSMSVAEWAFKLVRGASASALSDAFAATPFQNPRWVQAVAEARGRAHEFVAIQAQLPGGGSAYLFGGLHRRFGLTVFESMPMGGYGGWVGESVLSPTQSCELTSQWLRKASWPVMRFTTEPGQSATLPEPTRWPGIPHRLQLRLGPCDLQTHVLDLRGTEAERLLRARPSVRSYLRRVESLGFDFERGGTPLLHSFVDWYRRGSQDWRAQAGSLLPDAFFAALQEDRHADIWRVSREGQPLGAAIFLLGRRQVQYQASGTAKIAGPVSAMDALLWTAARYYSEQGLEGMNMGASDGLDSVRRFKEKFGAEPVAYRCTTYLMPRLAARLRLLKPW
jgi:hypothetical protein